MKPAKQDMNMVEILSEIKSAGTSLLAVEPDDCKIVLQLLSQSPDFPELS